MGITARYSLLAQVEDRALFLKHLIEEYPYLLKDWTEKTDKILREAAEEYAEGDSDIFHDTYSQMKSIFYENDYHEDAFYKAMILMVYAYYEGTIEFLKKETKLDDEIDILCKANNIDLSEKAKIAKNQIKNDIRVLRNHIAHNNMWSSKHKKSILRLSEQWPGIALSDDIYITRPDFILEYLEKEVFVLRELCEKLGYKHIRINHYCSKHNK